MTQTSSTLNPSEGFSRILKGIKGVLSEYLLLSIRSDLLYHRFLVHMRNITIRRAEVLLVITSALIIFFWPEDFLLDKSPELIESFAIYRTHTILGAVAFIVAVRVFPEVRKWPNLSYTLVIVQNMAIGGYLFGSVKDLTYVWFVFLAFIIPMYTIIQSLNFFRRLAATALLSFTYVTAYVISTGSVNSEYLYNFLPLLSIVVILNTFVGHTIFYFDFLSFIDERKLKQQQQKIKRLARHDQLTQLLNRSEFLNLADNAFEQSLRYDTNLSLAMIDLDSFKTVNDQYGHHAGDEVLSTFGEIIEANVRDADISCRYGGEEFSVLMPHTDAEGAREVAERLRQQLSLESFVSDNGQSFSVTCSIGIADTTSETESLDDLIQRADEALYEAKEADRNCTISSD